MLCAVRGAANAEQDTRDFPRTYRSVSTTLRAISEKFCGTCGEATMDRGGEGGSSPTPFDASI